MYLNDKDIKKLIGEGVLSGADASTVGQISCDLQTESFFTNAGKSDSATLAPGESVFVSCVECINLPDNLTATVLLRNSRIRQGLSLDAPLYFPGHKTRLFFRITNVSAETICLDKGNGIAQVVFESVSDHVSSPYGGVFADEFDYKGLADYSDIFAEDIKKIDERKSEVKGIEKRIYANVLALFAVFAAIFTLVNVNAGALQAASAPSGLIAIDLMIIGGFLVFASVIEALIADTGRRCAIVGVAAAGLFFVAVSIALSLV